MRKQKQRYVYLTEEEYKRDSRRVYIAFALLIACGFVLGVLANMLTDLKQAEERAETFGPTRYFTPINSMAPYTLNQQYKYITIDMKTSEFDIVPSQGNSMLPYFPNFTENIVVKPESTKDISIGDIIVFKCISENKTLFIQHRIVSTFEQNNQSFYVTQGDNNHDTDLESFGCAVRFQDIEWKTVGVLF